jgi:transposase
MFWVQVKCEDGLEESNCQNLEVKKGDEVVATTDEFGYAYFITTAIPESEVTIEIDTPTQNTVDAQVIMSPADPTYKVKLGLDPHVYMIEETFTNAVAGAKKKTAKRRTTKRRSKKGSRKKSSKRPRKKAAKKDKKKNEVIDLW